MMISLVDQPDSMEVNMARKHSDESDLGLEQGSPPLGSFGGYPDAFPDSLFLGEGNYADAYNDDAFQIDGHTPFPDLGNPYPEPAVEEGEETRDQQNPPANTCSILPGWDIQEGVPVYNYMRDASDRLDSSTPLQIKILLSQEAKEHVEHAHSFHDAVRGKLLRFDGAQIPFYDRTTGQMKTLQVPETVFSFSLDGFVLTVSIHRKHLPISKNFGDVPFRFAFFFRGVNVVVSTKSFEILSKEPSQQDKQKVKRAPKRKRGPSPKEPVAAFPTPEDDQVSKCLRDEFYQQVGAKRMRTEQNDDRASANTAENDSVHEEAF